MFEEIPLPLAWPVYVSQAEAAAFARWKGRRLPTEAEYHRAAYGSPGGAEREFPWGAAPPQPAHGNFDFQSWEPVPAGARPAGASAWGVHDLVGNGWEWTASEFAPFPGFAAMPSYPEYSAEFFDGRHVVLKGASPGDRKGVDPPQLPQLVPHQLSVRVCEVPHRLCRRFVLSADPAVLDTFAADVVRDLQRQPKQLQARYLYDPLGSSLFDAICRLPWYRITRAEAMLLSRHARDVARSSLEQRAGSVARRAGLRQWREARAAHRRDAAGGARRRAPDRHLRRGAEGHHRTCVAFRPDQRVGASGHLRTGARGGAPVRPPPSGNAGGVPRLEHRQFRSAGCRRAARRDPRAAGARRAVAARRRSRQAGSRTCCSPTTIRSA